LCPNIEEVILSGCKSLLQVYSSSFLHNLNCLRLDGCIELEKLDIRSNILSRSSGLVSLHGCHNLQTLLISGRTDVVQSDSCSPFNIDTVRVFNNVGTVLMGNGEERYKIKYSFTNINEFCWLDVSNCTSLTCLPAELLNLKFLTRLCLGGCLKLEELPEIEETMVGLEELSLKKCRRLKTIPSSIGNLSKLLKIDLYLL
jgi:Leucine-rich repeat (LRR) protein